MAGVGGHRQFGSWTLNGSGQRAVLFGMHLFPQPLVEGVFAVNVFDRSNFWL